MKVVSPEQMKKIDECAINEYGIPGILLMENAAAAVAAQARAMMGGCAGKRVTVVAGRGNNGGDAFAAARLLHSKGADVRVYLVGEKTGLSGDALFNMEILERIGTGVTEITENIEMSSFLADMYTSDLVIDGLFGTGLSRDIEGTAAEVIARINQFGRPVLSIDIPSGIDGRDGSIRGVCVKADATVTFGLPKLGLVLHPGCLYTGTLITADIGIPPCVIGKQDIKTGIIDLDMVSAMIPQRKPDSNKGDYGRVLIVTGSTGMTGSGCLASMAALRTGAGLVYTGVPQSLAPVYSSHMTEPIVIPLEDSGTGRLSASCTEHILGLMDKMDVVAIGPGLTAGDDIRKIVGAVIENCRVPLVMDADALNAISADPSVLKKLKAEAVLTPHPGEMARLTGTNTKQVQSDRIGTATAFAQQYGVTVVLKGNRTVVAYPDGRVLINTTGNAGMATAGTGDVLTGMIAGIAAQGVPAGDAAAAGVYLHGLAGDAAADCKGMHGMVAGDIVDILPVAIREALEGAQVEIAQGS
ncbi:MAG: NAD(P)H-hydrate dehydratase [Clostridiaceae bacterium]|nr:NAD(P)H-hydrate dehydratase [Clostridiaceae bacterium]